MRLGPENVHRALYHHQVESCECSLRSRGLPQVIGGPTLQRQGRKGPRKEYLLLAVASPGDFPQRDKRAGHRGIMKDLRVAV